MSYLGAGDFFPPPTFHYRHTCTLFKKKIITGVREMSIYLFFLSSLSLSTTLALFFSLSLSSRSRSYFSIYLPSSFYFSLPLSLSIYLFIYPSLYQPIYPPSPSLFLLLKIHGFICVTHLAQLPEFTLRGETLSLL